VGQNFRLAGKVNTAKHDAGIRLGRQQSQSCVNPMKQTAT
jgi:hypothetical protein